MVIGPAEGGALAGATTAALTLGALLLARGAGFALVVGPAEAWTLTGTATTLTVDAFLFARGTGLTLGIGETDAWALISGTATLAADTLFLEEGARLALGIGEAESRALIAVGCLADLHWAHGLAGGPLVRTASAFCIAFACPGTFGGRGLGAFATDALLLVCWARGTIVV